MIRLSEMVLPGHPDKFCDQVADAVIAECVRVDADAFGQVEVAVWGDSVGLTGGICTRRPLPKSMREIVLATDRANVGLVLDTCHFYAGGSSLESIERIQVGKLFILHINDVEQRPKESIEDAHRLLPGEGVIPLKDILVRLQRIGFDGLCSVELFRPAYWERDPAELAIAAYAASRRVLQPYFGAQ